MNNKTTVRLSLPKPLDRLEQLSPTALVVTIFFLLFTVGSIGRLQLVTSAAAIPTPQLPIVVIQKEPAQPLPTAVSQVQVSAVLPAARQVTAFAAPDGDVLGSIPWNANSPMLGRYGDNWILSTWQQGQVWIRASDIGISLANVAPAPATTSQEAHAAPIAPQPAPAIELSAEQQIALDRQFANVTQEQRDSSFAQHQAQQSAWCEGRSGAYCDMVRGAQP